MDLLGTIFVGILIVMFIYLFWLWFCFGNCVKRRKFFFLLFKNLPELFYDVAKVFWRAQMALLRILFVDYY